MSVELRQLLKEVQHMDITLLAGKKGLSNMVSWVHMIETKEASSFLEGGEIAFTTGIGLNNSLSILDLVANIRENHAAGIVINTGPFLEYIPKEVIDYGNTYDFPVFSVPWKIHIAEIMRIFSFMITKSEQADIEIAAAFKNAILFPKQEELFVVSLSSHGFHADWNYHACIISILDVANKNSSLKKLENICINLEHHLQHHKYKKFAIFTNDNQLVVITGNYNDEKLKQFMESIHAYLSHFLPENKHFFISIGKRTNSIRCLYKSYYQALSIQKFMNTPENNSKIFSYADMGIYTLLMSIDDSEILEDYYKRTVQPLVDYDKKYHSDLANVVQTYLRHDGSVMDTAKELYVHRNTVNYKLNQAAEILNKNLSSLDNRLQLMLGFMIGNLI